MRARCTARKGAVRTPRKGGGEGGGAGGGGTGSGDGGGASGSGEGGGEGAGTAGGAFSHVRVMEPLHLYFVGPPLARRPPPAPRGSRRRGRAPRRRLGVGTGAVCNV